MYDLIIVGAGPIGLAAACAAQDSGLSFLILDKAGPCQSIVEYAPRQSFYSPASELEVGGIPFPMAADDKPRREDALAYYRAVITSRRLPLQTWERVQSVAKADTGGFTVTTQQQPDAAWTKRYEARFVLVVSGVWDQPRTLDIPGADLKKVTTHYLGPTPYLYKNCLTVGGGNSAAEVAMSLARAGAKSSLALLEPSFDACNLRPFVRRELLLLVEERKIEVFFETEAAKITPTEVHLKSRADGSAQSIANDFVFILIGQNPDIPFFKAAGVAIDPEDLRPVYNPETFETGVPGLYVAGSLARRQHIVNGRPNAVKIVEGVTERLKAQ